VIEVNGLSAQRLLDQHLAHLQTAVEISTAARISTSRFLNRKAGVQSPCRRYTPREAIVEMQRVPVEAIQIVTGASAGLLARASRTGSQGGEGLALTGTAAFVF
jgi:hypothetical protein